LGGNDGKRFELEAFDGMEVDGFKGSDTDSPRRYRNNTNLHSCSMSYNAFSMTTMCISISLLDSQMSMTVN